GCQSCVEVLWVQTKPIGRLTTVRPPSRTTRLGHSCAFDISVPDIVPAQPRFITWHPEHQESLRNRRNHARQTSLITSFSAENSLNFLRTAHDMRFYSDRVFTAPRNPTYASPPGMSDFGYTVCPGRSGIDLLARVCKRPSSPSILLPTHTEPPYIEKVPPPVCAADLASPSSHRISNSSPSLVESQQSSIASAPSVASRSENTEPTVYDPPSGAHIHHHDPRPYYSTARYCCPSGSPQRDCDDGHDLEDSDSDSDDLHLLDAPPDRPPVLDADHEFARVADELTDFSLGRFQAWASSSSPSSSPPAAAAAAAAAAAVTRGGGPAKRCGSWPGPPSSGRRAGKRARVAELHSESHPDLEEDRGANSDDFDNNDDDDDAYDDDGGEKEGDDDNDITPGAAALVVGGGPGGRRPPPPAAPPLSVFPCPFYVADAHRHLDCLAAFDLRDLGSLKRHLWRSHRRPPHCPVCGAASFASGAACDAHVRARACVPPVPVVRHPSVTITTTAVVPPEGLSPAQALQLASRAPFPWASAALRWLAVWEIVYPGAAHPDLDRLGAGAAVSAVRLARDYWSAEGKRVVAEFLARRGLRGYELRDEERGLAALHALVLDRIIGHLIRTFSHDGGVKSGGRERPAKVSPAFRRARAHSL
ncbi:hypothetical protein GGR56DRAFT_682343, partial [Xylariaceae sp. FL0804]